MFGPLGSVSEWPESKQSLRVEIKRIMPLNSDFELLFELSMYFFSSSWQGLCWGWARCLNKMKSNGRTRHILLKGGWAALGIAAAHMSMTYDEKLTICRLRLEGKSISEIAGEVGFSYQAIYNFLRKLPSVTRTVRTKPSWSNKRVMSLCADYLSGASVSTLASFYKMKEQEILEIFAYFTEKRPSVIRNSMYPVLTDWIRLNGYTLKSFAAELDMTPNKLSRIFNGQGHMRYETAVKIRDFTGIPFSRIYAQVMVADTAPPVSTEPPAKLTRGAMIVG